MTLFVCPIKLLRISPQKIQVNVSVNYCHFCNLFNCVSLLSLFYVLQLQEKLQPHAIIPLPSKNICELWKVNFNVKLVFNLVP